MRVSDERLRFIRRVKSGFRASALAAKAAGYPMKEQAADMGMKLSSLYNATDEKSLAYLPPADLMVAHGLRLREFYQRQGLPVPDDCFAPLLVVNQLAGLVAFPLPDLKEDKTGMSKLVAENVEEFGDVLREIGATMADGKVEPDEYERLEKETMEQVRKSMAMLHAARELMHQQMRRRADD